MTAKGKVKYIGTSNPIRRKSFLNSVRLGEGANLNWAARKMTESQGCHVREKTFQASTFNFIMYIRLLIPAFSSFRWTFHAGAFHGLATSSPFDLGN